MAVANFAVLTKFRGLDQVSKPIKRMELNTAKFGRTADKSFKKASKSALGFRSVLGGILGAGLISSGLMRLRMGAAAVTDEFIDFDQAATAAAAKFPDGIKRGTSAFKQLKTAARDVGATTKFTAAEAAGGLDFLAMAGFNAKQAIAAIAPAAELAAVGNMDLARSTDIASDVLGAFQLKVDDSIQLTKNMTRVNDVMAKTITTANVDMEQLFETMKFGGPAAKAAGAEIETFSTIAAAMGNVGIKGSMAGTAMRTMFTNLAKPAKEARTLLKKMNVVVADGDGNFRDIFDILQDFNKATKDMGNKQRSAAVATVFGKRAISGVNAVLDKGADGLREYREMLEQANGTASKMAKDMNKGLGFRLKALKSAAIEMGFKFIDAFEDKLPGAIDAATAAVRNFDVKKVLDEIHKFGLFIDRATGFLRDMEPLIWGVVGGLTAYHGIVKAIMAFKFVKMLWGVVGVMGPLNALMAANPIGAIALGIAILIVIIVLLIKHWDKVTEVAKGMWKEIKIIFQNLWESFKKLLDNPFFRGIVRLFNPLLEIPMQIIRNWEPIKKWFSDFFAFLKPGFELLKKGFSIVAEKLGFGGGEDEKAKAPGRKAPNQKEVASKSQIDFMGRVMFEGAPKGTKYEGETKGAPPIMLADAGANP
jgi:TP901 family phage tail tape measure protein